MSSELYIPVVLFLVILSVCKNNSDSD